MNVLIVFLVANISAAFNHNIQISSQFIMLCLMSLYLYNIMALLNSCSTLLNIQNTLWEHTILSSKPSFVRREGRNSIPFLAWWLWTQTLNSCGLGLSPGHLPAVRSQKIYWSLWISVVSFKKWSGVSDIVSTSWGVTGFGNSLQRV